MAKKVTLTPSQIALAEADHDQIPGVSPGGDGEAFLEEVPEYETGNQPPEDSDTRDYYERARDGDIPKDDVVIDDAEDQKPKEWITDDLKNYALSYGLKEQDLDQFDSAEALQRFGELTDRRQAQSRYEQYQEPEPKQETKKEDKTEVETVETVEDETDYDAMIAKMEAENYDEVTISLAKQARDQAARAKAQDEKLKALEKRDQEREAAAAKDAEDREFQAEMLEVDQALDKMDPVLFGKSIDKSGNPVQLPPAFDENRRAVFSEYVRIKNSVADRGVEVPTDILVERARRTVFGGESVAERVAAQSRRRRPTGANIGQNGGAAPVSQPSSGNVGDDVAAIAQSPQMRAFWEKTQRANGQV